MADIFRLFVAIELPEAVIRHITEVMGRLREQALPGIRWVRPEGIHLTLRFLGNVPGSQVQSIVAAIQTAAAGATSFALQVQGVGAFPHLRAPRVLWVGVQGNLEPLVQVLNRSEGALEVQGFAREQRPFSPHLTLGRVKGRLSLPQVQTLAQAMDWSRDVGPAELPVTALSLMESQLTRNGAIYRRRFQIPLSNGLTTPQSS